MMRLRLVAIVTLLLIATVSSACIELTTTSSGGGGAGGTSASSGSNMATDCVEPYSSCAACEVCAGQRPEGKCANLYKACQGSMECATIDACVHGCSKGSWSCVATCWSMSTTGQEVYEPYYICMYCMECSTACASTIPCAG